MSNAIEDELRRTNVILGVAATNIQSDFAKNNPMVMDAYTKWLEYCLERYERSLTMLKVTDNNLDAALDKIDELT